MPAISHGPTTFKGLAVAKPVIDSTARAAAIKLLRTVGSLVKCYTVSLIAIRSQRCKAVPPTAAAWLIGHGHHFRSRSWNPSSATPSASIRWHSCVTKDCGTKLRSARSAALTAGYADRTEYFVERLARGLVRLAASVHPKPVVVRTSDFKTNEYAGLVGGAEFEPHEDNRMIGFRGASRFYSQRYREGFARECQAIRRLRAEMGFRNVIVVTPFCRSSAEARAAGAKIGLCGQAPSDNPAFAAFLVEAGISSISVSPDSFVAVKLAVAVAERQQHEETRP